MPRRRKIEVLTLAQRIAAELESGRVDDVDLSDEQVQRIAVVLRPAFPAERSRAARAAAVLPRLMAGSAAASVLLPAIMGAHHVVTGG